MLINDNIDYAEVFGEDISVTDGDPEVEAPDAASADDTSDTDTSVGENGDGDDNVTDTEDSAESSNESGESGSKPMQSSADNSKFAAARREAERQRDSAIAAERESSRKAIEEVFASLGLQDPYTGKPIRTKEEYDAYRNADSAQKKRDFMRENNMDERAYNSMIGELPEVRAAREAVERAQIAAQNAARERARTQLDEQIREIGTLDPSIKTIDDLTHNESYPKVFEMIKRGYTPVDAYRIANFDKLTKNASDAARQTVLNNQSGKEHLVQTTQRGTGIASVPADVRQAYRELNPDMSDAEIAKDYEKYLNQTRKK